MKTFKAGVIGIGFIGAAHIEALRRLGNVEVAALATRSKAAEKAAALFVPRAYNDWREMLDAEKLDCVHICSPNAAHFEQAKYALEKGVHVLCEKPLARTVSEAEALAALAAKSGLVAAVNYNCRFYPMAAQMRALVRSGALGKVWTVHGGYLQDWLFYDTDYSWRLESAVSGASRAFADIGTHWLDLARYVTGLKVTEVLADFETFHAVRRKPKKAVDTFSGMALRPEDYDEVPIDTEDYASVLFHFENNAHGNTNITQVLAGRKNQMILAVGGSKGSAHWDSEDSNSLWLGRRERENGQLAKDPSILAPEAAGTAGYPGGHVEGFPDTFRQCFARVYAAIDAGKIPDEPEFATFTDGLEEAVLCDRIIQSARERRWVKV